MPANKVDVVCVGVITMDTIALVDRYPSEDERVLAQEIARGGGGPAAVAAVALARLGISTAIVGTIGDDADGRDDHPVDVDTRGLEDVLGGEVGEAADERGLEDDVRDGGDEA